MDKIAFSVLIGVWLSMAGCSGGDTTPPGGSGGRGGADGAGGAGGAGGAATSCGDGVLQAPEQCDDGGVADGDKCSPTCQDQYVVEIVAGFRGACARLNDGRIKCWGGNGHGQLGLEDVLPRGDGPNEMGAALPATKLGAVAAATAIIGQNEHRCALFSDMKLKCWGHNSNGQLGLGDLDSRGDQAGEMGDALPFVDLGAGAAPTSVVAGHYHNCVILPGGALKCWGMNGACQLGQGVAQGNVGDKAGQMGDALPATDLGAGSAVVEVAPGGSHTCARLASGAVKCWGSNTSGQLGLGDATGRGCAAADMGDNLPAVDVGGKVKAISAGLGDSCAILEDGSVKCWGANEFGQLGQGNMTDIGKNPGEMGAALLPVDLGAGEKAAQISAGAYHTCVILESGAVKCWGRNDNGQLGQGHTQSVGAAPGQLGAALPPVELGAGRTATQIRSGFAHTCALLDDSSVKCWGASTFGALGQGNTGNLGSKPGEMGDALPTVKLFSDLW